MLDRGFKRGWHHREHGGGGGKSFQELQLETIVETGGIADVLLQQPEPCSGCKRRANLAFFGAQPAAVGNNSVDFTVVRYVAEGLREMPGRLGIGGIELVKNGKGGGKRGI